jgi:capsular exopolysaccharide synthesis family protein
MDKLEKAVQKARLCRNAEEVHTAHAASYPVPPPSPALAQAEAAQLEDSRIVAHRPRDHAADVFRILRTQILQIMGQSEHRSLAVVSPNYGDGKSTIAFNLAVSIAQDVKQTVLLCDLDLRKPDIHNFIGLESPPGLTDYLIDDKPLSECFVRPSFLRFSILPAGRAVDNSSELLGSPKMAALAGEMETRYADRVVIYDMPPILLQADPITFLPHVGAVLVVVREGVTTAKQLKRALEMLAGTHVIGTVLNDSTE